MSRSGGRRRCRRRRRRSPGNVIAAAEPQDRERAKNLLWAAGRLADYAASLYPSDVPLSRERAKAPYSPAEIGGFLALADAQPTAERRMRATGLVCLGAGAGLIRADLRDVRGSDVLRRSGAVVVQVRGGRGRVVPALARYHAPLLAAARSAGDGLVLCGTDPGRRNLTNPLAVFEETARQRAPATPTKRPLKIRN
jgi:hypothetical protein